MARGPGKSDDKKVLTKEERQARRQQRLAEGKPVRARLTPEARAKRAADAEKSPGARGKAAGAEGKAGTHGGKIAGGRGRKANAQTEKGAKRVRAAVIPARGGAPDKTVSARKVMVIGFQKTGTTTMTDALRSLGFSVGQASQAINLKLKGQTLPPEEIDATVRAMAFEIADKADAVQDSPYPLLFKELDERYPGSKFVYLDREPDSWVKSVVGHFGTGSTALRDWIYGESQPVGNEEIYRKRFLGHRDEVRAYFADRPDDILYMNLSEGDGWLKLVTFLGAADLLPSFPHRNKRS